LSLTTFLFVLAVLDLLLKRKEFRSSALLLRYLS